MVRGAIPHSDELTQRVAHASTSSHDARDPEITQRRVARRGQKYVVGLDVAVRRVPRVHVLARKHNLRQNILREHDATEVPDYGVHVEAADKPLHDDEHVAVVSEGAQRRYDERVGHRSCNRSFVYGSGRSEVVGDSRLCGIIPCLEGIIPVQIDFLDRVDHVSWLVQRRDDNSLSSCDALVDRTKHKVAYGEGRR